MHFAFNINKRDFEYLKIQKGGISHSANDYDEWLLSYKFLMHSEFDTIKPYLPVQCARTLDVGGGLGGINCMINRHYGGNLHVEVLDADETEPVVIKQDQPFNSMQVTKEFLRANGVRHFTPRTPDSVRDVDAPLCDMVTSFGSWCFHYSPDTYLEYVKMRSHAATVLIIDVRIRHDDWIDQLEREFNLVASLDLGEKYARKVYRFT